MPVSPTPRLAERHITPYARSVAEEDVRWKQRYESFRRSVENLQEALSTEQPNKLERQGIIKAFEAGLLQDGELWRAIHRARNESAQVYNEDTARDLERRIRRDYTPALETLRTELAERYEQA